MLGKRTCSAQQNKIVCFKRKTRGWRRGGLGGQRKPMILDTEEGTRKLDLEAPFHVTWAMKRCKIHLFLRCGTTVDSNPTVFEVWKLLGGNDDKYINIHIKINI